MRERAARDLANMVTVYAEIHSPKDIWRMITEGADLPKPEKLEKKGKKRRKARTPAEKQAARVRRREYKRDFQRLLRLGMKRGGAVPRTIERTIRDKFTELGLLSSAAAAFERDSTPCAFCGRKEPNPSCPMCAPDEADVPARKRGRRP